MRKELITLGKKEPAERPMAEIKIAGLPKRVREFFDTLPRGVRREIAEYFDGGTMINKTTTGWEKFLERANRPESMEVVAAMDAACREKYFIRAFDSLFAVKSFKENFVQSAEPGRAMEKLLETLWSNRTRVAADRQIFGQPFYDKFQKERLRLESSLIGYQVKLAEAKQKLERAKGKKRMSEQLRHEIFELQEDRGAAEKALDSFDFQYDNANPLGTESMARREEKEKEWTVAIADLARYYEPGDFAVLAMEALENKFYFEKAAVRNQAYFGRPIEPDVVNLAKAFFAALESAAEKWAAQHAGEGALETERKMAGGKRKEILLQHLRARVEAYSLQAKRANSPEEKRDLEIAENEMIAVLRIVGGVGESKWAER